jgi:hypothetical protein
LDGKVKEKCIVVIHSWMHQLMDENWIDFATNYGFFYNYCNNFVTCTLMISPYAYVNLNLLLQLTYNNPTRKHCFSNKSNWLTSLFLLMDMSILTRGANHFFFYQSTWLGGLIWPIHLVKLNNLNQNGQWVLVKGDI